MENEKPMGLYVHIPFCASKCDYCDFVSYAMDEEAQKYYLEALMLEIDRYKMKFYDKKFDTLYIGGGTPSVVFNGFIKKLSEKIFSSFCFADKTEFTIEINPASFTREKLMEYCQAGVNRISVGVQCLDERLLASHGRFQTNAQVQEAFALLKESKFENVSADVMIGLPGQSYESIIETLNFLIKHNVKHISAYTMQIEKYTNLYNNIRAGRMKKMSDKKIASLYKKVASELKAEGFKRYEISNYARPCFESKHNKKYWDGTNYLGLGVSAHSFIDNHRICNTKRLDIYIDAMFEGRSAVYTREYITEQERKVERIMLSLRTSQGLNLQEYQEEFGEDIKIAKHAQILNLTDKGFLVEEDGYLKIPSNQMNVANAIIVELI